jgi:hypothetical protein
MNPLQEQIDSLTNRLELLERGSNSNQKTDVQILDLFNKNLFDYIWRKVFHFQTFFESLTGFLTTVVGTGTSVTTGYGMALATSNANNDSVMLGKVPTTFGWANFSLKSNIRTTVGIDNAANITCYIVVGDLGGDYYGFKVVNGALYGVTRDNATETAVSLGTTMIAAALYNIEARYTPNDKVSFYINKELKGVSTTHLPRQFVSGKVFVNPTLMTMKVQTTTTAVRTLYAGFFEYLQDKEDLRY